MKLEVERAQRDLVVLKIHLGVIVIGFLIAAVASPFVGSRAMGYAVAMAMILIFSGAVYVYKLMKVPLALELHPTKLVFDYLLDLSLYPRQIFWVDVTELEVYGNLRDRQGHDLNLSYLNRDQYYALYNYYWQLQAGQQPTGAYVPQPPPSSQPYPGIRGAVSQPPVASSLPPGATPRQILTPTPIEWGARRPSSSVTLTSKPLRFILSKLFIISLMLFVIPVFVYSLFMGGGRDLWNLLHHIIILVLGPLLIIGLLYQIRHALKSRKLTVDSNGIQLTQKGRLIFLSRWPDITRLHIWAADKSYRLHIESPLGDHSVSEEDLPTPEFRRVFDIIREYAEYYRIELTGERKWEDG